MKAWITLRTCESSLPTSSAIRGAAMPVDVLHQFEKVTGCSVYEGYGLTETTVSVCCNRPGDRKIGTIGKPFRKLQIWRK